MTNSNSFKTHQNISVDGTNYHYHSLPALKDQGYNIDRLPYSLRVLLENLLRHEDGKNVTKKDIEALLNWDPQSKNNPEIAFTPARVILQDFTGVPAVVDLAAMRDAMTKLGGNPNKINPLQPVELVIDHSVQVDFAGASDSLLKNTQLEFDRNKERYTFLKWGQQAFENFKVVPPETGIVHQVNVEFLARVAMTSTCENNQWIYPDTLVGTDSHTTMVNGLGVLGWGVGGIEAEAAMLGQPQTMLIPEVVGFKLNGSLREGTTATDLVLTVTQLLRKKGVVGKFVEFFGEGAAELSLADRATIANMAPEYGATCGFFPVDEETLNYLKLTARSENQINLTRTYMSAQKLLWTTEAPTPEYSDILELNLEQVQTSLAGPSRPQDRVTLSAIKSDFLDKLQKLKPQTSSGTSGYVSEGEIDLRDGSIVLAAITSCTNTSNPSVLIAAGLLAKKAVEKGLAKKPWVKTSLAPGSQVVTEYLKVSGLLPYLERLGFYVVGYGCTTCIGNSGPLPEDLSSQIKEKGLVAVSVLSGNRNFEGRVHAEIRANYLASPPLVVAYALAGRIDLDLTSEPIDTDKNGNPIKMSDLWPTTKEIENVIAQCVTSDLFRNKYRNVFLGSADWQSLPVGQGSTYTWDNNSTYVQHPPYFTGMGREAGSLKDISNARVLAVLGDSITTDHISPAGSIKKDSPAGKYLLEKGVPATDFNSYGSRRGNHEVMVRGTFANTRLKNKLAPGTEGGWSRYFPTDEVMPLYDAAMKYQSDGTPLVVLAGKEYGSGSSRDWAAKGPALLGIKAVIAESYERIHRSNLVGMGILPLQFTEGDSPEKLGLTGEEKFNITGIADGMKPRSMARIVAERKDGSKLEFEAMIRIDTPVEIEYYRHGGILLYVLRGLL